MNSIKRTDSHITMLISIFTRIPENYIIERLQPDYCTKMMKQWDFSFADTPENVAERIEKFHAYGAFYVSNGVSLCHVFIYEFHSISQCLNAYDCQIVSEHS